MIWRKAALMDKHGAVGYKHGIKVIGKAFF